MKKLVIFTALMLLLGVGGLATAAKPDKDKDKKPQQPTRVDTEVTLALERGNDGNPPYTPPGKARFSGTVSASVQFCVRNRAVNIHIKGKGQPGVTVETNNQGNFSVLVDEPLAKGQYRARAEKAIQTGSEKNWKRGRKLVCRAGRSNVVTVF